ncbi:uncharacterized membrane protein HdeD (DUF308 family) [Leucobacter luti]|uniref:HdeD family acid-resistance protein n=1 Tax=Leucobacter luti TaxID=340320 RepID=UPI0010EF8C51|nr:DUF308 domain-containing protein [Leucobacter luti]MCW2289423.1 uncharacterized membrane protein HdeD (DUF308 family) [Leucobacter luti]TCK39982.1 uncharacterized membrane protein HdeD (DUF308 family) [Leucobacter luti]
MSTNTTENAPGGVAGSDAQVTTRLTDGIRTAFGVGGLIALVLGLLIIFNPAKSGAVAMQILAVVMAAYALVVGVVYLGSSIFSRSMGGWSRVGHILLGLLYVIGGIVMMLNIGAAGVVIALFLSITVGILWLFEGVMAFTVAGKSDNKVWTIIYGVVSVIAGLVLLFSPLLGAVTLWLLLGISMVVMGIVQVIRAFSVKSI